MNQQAMKAAALADELHKRLYPQKTDADGAGNENTDEALVSLEDGDQENQVVDTTVDTAAEPTDLEKSESKFKVLQGKYNAEVPRLHQEIRELTSTTQSLQAQLEQAQTPATVAKDLEETDLNIEAYAEYGEEFEQLAQMVKSLTSKVETLKNENTSLRTSVDNVEVNSASEKFWDRLEAAVPDWETINTNPDFVQWLQEVDDISGITRQTHLNDASETLNANKTIKIFKKFNDSVAKENTNNGQRNNRIARQAQPNSVNTAAPTSPNKRLYTRKEIKEFYKDVSSGKWKGHEAELKQVEADIFAAPLEGRIIG